MPLIVANPRGIRKGVHILRTKDDKVWFEGDMFTGILTKGQEKRLKDERFLIDG